MKQDTGEGALQQSMATESNLSIFTGRALVERSLIGAVPGVYADMGRAREWRRKPCHELLTHPAFAPIA